MYEQVCKEDLATAILFFTSFEEDTRGVVIQCEDVSHIPYIRHNLRRELGAPDRFVGNSLYYNRRPITIVSVPEYEEYPERYDEDTLFFVSVRSEVSGL